MIDPPNMPPPEEPDPFVARLPIARLPQEQQDRILPLVAKRITEGEPPPGKAVCDACERLVDVKAEGMTLSRSWFAPLGMWWVSTFCLICADRFNPNAEWLDDEGRSLRGVLAVSDPATQFRAEEVALGALIDRIRDHAVVKNDLPWASPNNGRMYQQALIRAQRALGDAIQFCGFELVDLAPDGGEVLGERV